MADNKKLIWIGVASALLIGGGIFWWIRSKAEAEAEEARKQEEETKKAEEEAKPNAPRTIQYPATPYTNRVDGDKFRAWVNKTYPSFAKQIDLSLSGDFNNSIIRKAYAQYGAEYTKSLAKSTTSAHKGWKSGDKVYLGSADAGVYSYPTRSSSYVIGNLSKALSLDKPVGVFLSDTGKGFYYVRISSYLPAGKMTSKNYSDLKIGSKDVYLPSTLVSNKPY